LRKTALGGLGCEYLPGVAVKPITDIDDPRYIKALAHPLRIRILAMLEEQPASPVQLTQKLDATLGTVAYHVRTLHQLGLVELVDTRQRRGATEHYYRAREHPRFTDDAWEALGPVAKQRMLSATLRQIGEYASGSAAAGGFDRKDAHITRTALRLDEQGWRRLADAIKKWLREVERIEESAQKRLGAKEHAGEINAGLVMMLFEALPFSEQDQRDSRASKSGASRRARRGARRGRADGA
jgi:DNA-binding transcriptional ArsR family regulator